MGTLFDDILNGNISLSEEVVESTVETSDELFTEATDVKVLPRLKMVNRQVYLPKGQPLGKGNICFLYTNSFNQSSDMIGSKINFLSNGRYKYYYYPPIYKGFVNTNLFNIKDTTIRKEYYAEISKTKGIRGYMNPRLGTNDNTNTFIDLHKYLNILSESCYPTMPFSKYLSIYWTYMYKILDMNTGGSFDNTSSYLKKMYVNIPYTTSNYSNKFVLCNIDNYKLGKNLKENIRHPLFGLYYTLYRMPYMIQNLNIDFFFYTGKFVLVVNPSMVQDKKLVRQLRVEMMKLMNKTSYREEIADVVDEEKIAKSEIEDQAASKISDEMPTIASKDIDDSVSKIVTKKVDALNNVIVIPPDDSDEKVGKVSLNQVIITPDKIDDNGGNSTNDQKNLADNVKNGMVDAVAKQSEQDIENDEELLRKIYNELEKAKPDATPMSARDREFREKLKNNQRDVAIKTMTVKDISKIRGKDISIQTNDVSNVTTGMNDNMTQITFDNFEKTYNEKLMEKDLVASITALNDKSIPLYISSIDIKDTSDELNYKDTYTIHLIDANHKKQTIKVDIPKFLENKFLLIGGNKMLIKKQLFFYPVVKVNESTVHVTTNYNKIIIERVDTKYVPVAGRLNILLKKSDKFKGYCEMGNAYVNNSDYITTVEYDSISKIIVSFKCNGTEIYFNQIEANELAKKKNIEGSVADKLFIGFKDKKPIYINTETAVGSSEKSIADYVIEALPEDIQHQFELIKPPRSNVMVRGQLMKKPINIGPLLGLWVGFTKLIKALNLEYRLENKVPELKADESYIKFKDCVFVYKATMTAMFILNGFADMKPEQYNLTDLDVSDSYVPYLLKIYGRSNVENALYNFYEFLIDPITKEVCQDLNIPDNTVDLILYAVSLLSDNRYVPEINLGVSRIRSNEIVAAILYEQIAKNYIKYRNSNGTKPLSIPQNAVIKELVGLKTVDNYSTLNPSLEMDMTYGVSSRGFRGTNLDQAYTTAKRSYDKTMTGTIAVGNQPDANVGVNKTLTLEPNIYGLRGYTKPYTGNKDSDVQTKDINLLSPVELTMPISTRYDDSTRLGFHKNAWLSLK